MPINNTALLDDAGTAIGESLYLSEGLGVDITILGRRYLQAGYIETDSGTYDTNAHQGAHAGSSTPSSKGACKRYVRIT